MHLTVNDPDVIQEYYIKPSKVQVHHCIRAVVLEIPILSLSKMKSTPKGRIFPELYNKFQLHTKLPQKGKLLPNGDRNHCNKVQSLF